MFDVVTYWLLRIVEKKFSIFQFEIKTDISKCTILSLSSFSFYFYILKFLKYICMMHVRARAHKMRTYKFVLRLVHSRQDSVAIFSECARRAFISVEQIWRTRARICFISFSLFFFFFISYHLFRLPSLLTLTNLAAVEKLISIFQDTGVP